jgi:sporulation protein YlmC with PRC-barrel domain
MELGQALLDQQVTDRQGEQMGKVDGVVVELRRDRPPRIAALLIGGGTAAERVHPGWARWLTRWRKRWGPKQDQPFEIPWSKVTKIGVDVKVNLQAERTPALAWEHWVRDRIIGRIPGA